MKKFIQVLIHKMRIKEILSYIQEIREVLKPIVTEDAAFNSMRAGLDTDHDSFSELFNKKSTKVLSAELKELDQSRDRILKGLTRYCEAFMYSDDKTQEEAAIRLNDVIERNGKRMYRESYETQSALVQKLFNEFEGMRTDVNAIQLQTWIEMYNVREASFEEKHKERQEAMKDIPTSTASDLSTQIFEKVNALWGYMEAMANYANVQSFGNAIDEINVITGKYNAVIRSRTTRAEKLE